MKKIILALVVIFIGIQLIPVERTNPPITQDINPPQNVSEILRTSCYDCHSNETVWPWYSYIAPVSFLVSSDVENARKRVNFSEWDKYDDKKKTKKLEAIIEDIEGGVMPLSKYVLLHHEAKMDQSKIQTMKDWVESGNIQEEKLRYKKEDDDD